MLDQLPRVRGEHATAATLAAVQGILYLSEATIMKTLGMTQSTCVTCRRIVPAKVLADDAEGSVYFKCFCPEHGEQQRLIHRDIDMYLRSQYSIKSALIPQIFAGDSTKSCPDGCGFCDRHEQHLCMPIVEITQRCDLACPICLVSAGGETDMMPAEFHNILDRLIKAEGQIDILNLSGGEPLLHPDILELIDDALARPQIVRVSISTNGLQLLAQPQHKLLKALTKRDVVISLQFDGFDDNAITTLRGQGGGLLKQKQKILNLLAKHETSTSLTMTLAGGVNDHQLAPVLDYYFSQPHIVSMMIQPIAFTGRATHLTDSITRLTIPDVLRLLDTAGNPRVKATDFAPLPCSHPLCFNLAYYLMLDDGRSAPLNKLLDAHKLMDSLANRTVFGLDEQEIDQIKDIIYDLWGDPTADESIMKTLRSILDEFATPPPPASERCPCFDPRRTFGIAQRRIKSIFIHAFQDAETFDLARVRRCCNAYPLADGRLMPACVYNVRERGGGRCR